MVLSQLRPPFSMTGSKSKKRLRLKHEDKRAPKGLFRVPSGIIARMGECITGTIEDERPVSRRRPTSLSVTAHYKPASSYISAPSIRSNWALFESDSSSSSSCSSCSSCSSSSSSGWGSDSNFESQTLEGFDVVFISRSPDLPFIYLTPPDELEDFDHLLPAICEDERDNRGRLPSEYLRVPPLNSKGRMATPKVPKITASVVSQILDASTPRTHDRRAALSLPKLRMAIRPKLTPAPTIIDTDTSRSVTQLPVQKGESANGDRQEVRPASAFFVALYESEGGDEEEEEFFECDNELDAEMAAVLESSAADDENNSEKMERCPGHHGHKRTTL